MGRNQINRDKAAFLLDSIRKGGLHDLMKKEIIKLVYGAGYREDQISYYLSHGRWPSGKRPIKEPSPIETVYEEQRDMSKTIIRKSVFIVVMLILVTFGALFFFSIMGAVDGDEKPQLKVIETTKDGKKVL